MGLLGPLISLLRRLSVNQEDFDHRSASGTLTVPVPDVILLDPTGIEFIGFATLIENGRRYEDAGLAGGFVEQKISIGNDYSSLTGGSIDAGIHLTVKAVSVAGLIGPAWIVEMSRLDSIFEELGRVEVPWLVAGPHFTEIHLLGWILGIMIVGKRLERLREVSETRLADVGVLQLRCP
jgi:hypothetical protein